MAARVNNSGDQTHRNRDKSVIESLVLGSLSSALTTTIYQPLELVKTRIQLREVNPSMSSNNFVIGRATRSLRILTQQHNLRYLWRGTGASLLRSVPGVGIYYASLNILQRNFSEHPNRPDSAKQAFYFGLAARSLVSVLLLPITVVKVRYESGQFVYSSLPKAISEAYWRIGWVGVVPTALRDSLFSGTYLMCYTGLKNFDLPNYHNQQTTIKTAFSPHVVNFCLGIVSGLVASILTNPIDVMKTNIQVNTIENNSMKRVAINLLSQDRGYLRFLDGIILRSVRRSLIAASTWTFYEFVTSS